MYFWSLLHMLRNEDKVMVSLWIQSPEVLPQYPSKWHWKAPGWFVKKMYWRSSNTRISFLTSSSVSKRSFLASVLFWTTRQANTEGAGWTPCFFLSKNASCLGRREGRTLSCCSSQVQLRHSSGPFSVHIFSEAPQNVAIKVRTHVLRERTSRRKMSLTSK